jgi:hypothetical protein
MNGKYRIRTWVRGRLPSTLAQRLRKGRDCRAHEWYRQDAHVDACYHCVQLRPHERSPVSLHELEDLVRAAMHGSRAALDVIDRLVSEGAVHLVRREAVPHRGHAICPARIADFGEL